MHKGKAQCSILALLCLFGLTGCNRLVTWASTKTAPWSYVEDGWGGTALESYLVESNQVNLKFKLLIHDVKRIDSGICSCGTSAKLQQNRILVRMKSCLCGPGADTHHVAIIRRPPPGQYLVVYDDPSANYPRIGEITIP